ncbi:MAG TPA: tetratricopeptide repeat protein [Chthoniobacterales bacterium]|jgi:TolB-like protein|nr:tetratricopeptide repeat protein [Chthoniobacterales bacterium]
MKIDNFFAELKRRNVYKVAVAYAVVGWLIAQIATQIFPFLEIPNWIVRLVIVLIAIGFPIALVIAWAFEATPEGIKRTETVDAMPPTLGQKKHAWIYIVVIGALLSIGLFFLGRYTAGNKTTASPNDVSNKSIAVLPFENLSSDKENAYFAEGIQDEILTRLAKIGALKVISRTSTSHYASSPQNLPEIARQLGVANILEGSVQKARDAVHVNVQLIRAATDDHLWAESYDRTLDDIFGVEKEVAQSIAAALNAKLTGAEEQAIAQKPTANSSAYEAYLRGNTQFWEINEQSLLAAGKSYQEAVRLDPQFAIAWAALARLDAVLYWIDDTTAARRAAAEQAVNEAERLQPKAAETKVARGYFTYLVQHDLKGTVDLMEQAHQTWPNNAEVLQLLSFAAARLGDWNKSDIALDQAVVLNPRDLATRRWSINNRLDSRDFVTARRLADEALQVWPDEPNLLAYKAETFQASGQLDQAQALISQMKPGLKDYDALSTIWYQAKLRRDPAPAMEILEPLARPTDSGFDWMFNAAQLADLQALSGDHASSQSIFRQVRDRAAALAREQPENVRYLGPLAQALSHLGEREAALNVIDKAMALRAGDRRSQPSTEEQRARVLALFGEKDQAIEILQRLMQTRYSGWAAAPLTPALLRLDPDFDALRSDSRFQKLCQDKPE